MSIQDKINTGPSSTLEEKYSKQRWLHADVFLRYLFINILFYTSLSATFWSGGKSYFAKYANVTEIASGWM